MTRSMPVDRAITNVYLRGWQTYAACPAWFVDQLWERPNILWHIEQTSERLGQCSAPAMPAGPRWLEIKGRNAHWVKSDYKNGSKHTIQIITNQNRRYNSIYRSRSRYVMKRKNRPYR